MPETTTPREQPRLCDLIRKDQEGILLEWLDRLRGEHAGDGLSDAELRDRLPELLRRLAKVVGSVHTGASESLEGLPGSHAVDRLDQGVALETLVTEYTLLRLVILEHYRRVGGEAVSVEEVERLNLAIDDAVRISAARYANTRARTLHALDRLSQTALLTEDVSSFLGGLLQIVVETVEAVDMGAVFLWEDGALRVRASVGMPEGFDALALELNEGFAGKVAAERRPIELHDAAQDPSVRLRSLPPDTRALYGVPLLADGQVIGVTYLGSRSAYEFAREDSILLRSMAARATSFVVHAQLRRAERAERDRAQQAEARLHQAAEFRETFLDILSHDLRNLLGVITGTVRVLLASDQLSQRAEGMVSRVSRAAEQMNRMIRDLLDLTRGRLGAGIPVTPKPVDLRLVCSALLDEVRAAHPDREFHLSATGDLQGRWDEDRMGQAMMNLCRNADDYGEPGTPIRVSVVGTHDSVEIAVENEGEPIPAARLANIFEPYVRATRRRTDTGLGLGLFIVREVARAHGGDVEVRQDGRRVSFVIHLPRHASPVRQLDEREPGPPENVTRGD